MEQFTLEGLLGDENSAVDGLADADGVVEETAIVEQPRRKLRPRGISAATYYSVFDETGYAAFLRQVAAIGLSVKSRRAEDMKEGLEKYLKLCADQNRRITNQACYTAMGINRQIAYNMEHGKSGTPEQKKLIDFVKGLCATYREGMMVTGDLNPIVGIFWQKAFDGLNEMDEVNAAALDISEYNPDQDAESIAEKYENLPD